jgi:hypothetical protein
MGCSSERVILVCEHCGERLVLGEPEEVWLSRRTHFECECGREVSWLIALRTRPERRTTRLRNKARHRRHRRGTARSRSYWIRIRLDEFYYH